MATDSSTLAWKIPWTEEPGRLQSMDARRHQIAGDSKMKNRLISGTKIANRRITQTASSVETVLHR